jgi:hypothetical protein
MCPSNNCGWGASRQKGGMSRGHLAQVLLPKGLYLVSGVVITLYSQWIAAQVSRLI